MNSAEWAAGQLGPALFHPPWFERGWLLVLAFTGATLCVAALRRPCRRLFGAQRAFQLWLLPPLAMLASQLPHAVSTAIPALPPLVLAVTSAGGLRAHAVDSSGNGSGVYVALVWVTGALLIAGRAALAQRRYHARLRGAIRLAGLSCRWPVWRATDMDIGPALVGAWRAKIVLPNDFDSRYNVTERRLILAHETMHARRCDGWWSLLAQIAATMFWFHPLAWLGLAAFRRDQELACDAAVLRERGAHLRSYASAMLKTQSAPFSLPVGCYWSPRHPLTERIAMLKRHRISTLRLWAGGVLLGLLACGSVGLVYAASGLPAERAPQAGAYTLRLVLSVDGKPARLHATICLLPGHFYDVTEVAIGKLPPWHGRFTVAPAEHKQLEVQAELSGGSLPKPVFPRLRMLPGQQGTIQTGQQVLGKDGQVAEDHTIKIDLTPSLGC